MALSERAQQMVSRAVKFQSSFLTGFGLFLMPFGPGMVLLALVMGHKKGELGAMLAMVAIGFALSLGGVVLAWTTRLRRGRSLALLTGKPGDVQKVELLRLRRGSTVTHTVQVWDKRGHKLGFIVGSDEDAHFLAREMMTLKE